MILLDDVFFLNIHYFFVITDDKLALGSERDQDHLFI